MIQVLQPYLPELSPQTAAQAFEPVDTSQWSNLRIIDEGTSTRPTGSCTELSRAGYLFNETTNNKPRTGLKKPYRIRPEFQDTIFASTIKSPNWEKRVTEHTPPKVLLRLSCVKVSMKNESTRKVAGSSCQQSTTNCRMDCRRSVCEGHCPSRHVRTQPHGQHLRVVSS